MRLSTIWTLPSMPMMERFRRTRDWSAMEIASMLPRRIKYWVTLQEIGKATRKSANIPATPLEQILENLQTPKDLS